MSKSSACYDGKHDSCIFLQGIMLVFDVTEVMSFNNIKRWLDNIDVVRNVFISNVI